MEKNFFAFCNRVSERIGTKVVGILVCSYEDIKNADVTFLITPGDNTDIVEQLEENHNTFYRSFEEFVWRELFCERIGSRKINENFRELRKAYRKGNYKAVSYDNVSRRCYLLFSEMDCIIGIH